MAFFSQDILKMIINFSILNDGYMIPCFRLSCKDFNKHLKGKTLCKYYKNMNNVLKYDMENLDNHLFTNLMMFFLPNILLHKRGEKKSWNMNSNIMLLKSTKIDLLSMYHTLNGKTFNLVDIIKSATVEMLDYFKHIILIENMTSHLLCGYLHSDKMEWILKNFPEFLEKPDLIDHFTQKNILTDEDGYIKKIHVFLEYFDIPNHEIESLLRYCYSQDWDQAFLIIQDKTKFQVTASMCGLFRNKFHDLIKPVCHCSIGGIKLKKRNRDWTNSN
jgi:hypothetical protein